jgi:urea transporter
MKKNWFLRVSQWQWSPFVLGAVVCLAVVAIAKIESWEAVPAGLGFVCFVWLVVIKGLMVKGILK